MKPIVFTCCLVLLLSVNVWGQTGSSHATFRQKIAALETEYGGRLGVAAINPANNDCLEYKANQRFAMCSTFKLLLVADLLSRVDKGKEHLDRLVSYDKGDLLDYAPITRKHVDAGKMSIFALCDAAIRYSDNTAANLLLKTVGGPSNVTGYIRAIGDTTTRLDRNEPMVNTNIKGDPRDTSTPDAMVRSMQKLLVGNALSTASRQQLIQWLVRNTTGDARLRAGLPEHWKIGDKTGSGSRGASNDVAIVWPPNHQPILICVYYSGSKATRNQQSAVIAKVGQIISKSIE